MLCSALLVLLEERDGHGYELLNRLEGLHVAAPDSGAIYRILRQMEDEGLVASRWDGSDRGPARRVYSMTSLGAERLRVLALHLAAQRRSMGLVLQRHRRACNWAGAALSAV